MAEWTASVAALSISLFIIAGFLEVGGGWLVWQAVREGKPWYWAAVGCWMLVVYGFIPTLQPIDDFGRLYAVYGGFFIVLSYVWGYALDGFKPDVGDYVGGSIALAGVMLALLWPRDGGGLEPDADSNFV
ncbi:uncharacterized protein MICPUCDRAFT_23124 [Micromonas pusilla CCMP1545]|uniref:Predicted protein n=1 Tax=Micromonas pusilla (strain CCMP1545) TaxID=564608 RepID=C1N8B6_MICPC|nr:uncharacterized protein MICPUCDRAFT_23124 [Micromonas pusilla CCMP1545]EEH51675.1 predicted protein [Micromonas pusilla CCMP1545]|eukprot:XP_003064053.1 predicted protein [Micromonas pusilla CCMP1545]